MHFDLSQPSERYNKLLRLHPEILKELRWYTFIASFVANDARNTGGVRSSLL